MSSALWCQTYVMNCRLLCSSLVCHLYWVHTDITYKKYVLVFGNETDVQQQLRYIPFYIDKIYRDIQSLTEKGCYVVVQVYNDFMVAKLFLGFAILHKAIIQLSSCTCFFYAAMAY